MHYLFFIFLIIVSPCISSANCIRASDIVEEDIIDIVYTNSDKNNPEPGCSKHWVKSQIPLTSNQRIVEIIDREVNLCSQSGGGSENITLDMGAIDQPIPSIPLNLRQYDSIKLSSLPPISGEITEAICENSNSDIKVFDIAKCKADFIGKSYTSIISNNIALAESNVINYHNVHTSSWVSSPLYIIDPPDGDGKTIVSKSIEQLSPHFSSNDDLWQKVCNYDPTTFPTQSLKPHIENIRNGMSSYEINKICGNICHIQYDKNGSQVRILNNNCVFSLSSEKKANGEYYSYLPGLVVKEGGITLGLVGSLSPRGIELNKEYQLNSANPQVWMDIGRGNTGGYKLLISRKCTYHNKRSLYYYLGNSCPSDNIIPGGAGTLPIEMIKGSNYVNRRMFTLDPSWDGQEIYYGVKDNGDGESNNSGYFELITRMPKAIKTPFSNMLNWVVEQVNRLLYGDNTPINPGAVGKIYQTFINGPFVGVMQSVLVLYIAVYALLYMIGMIRSSQTELIVILVKVGIIFALISPNSWEFFNEYLFKLFTEGTIYLINIMSSHTDSDIGFKFIDKSLARFAEVGTWIQIFSLIFTGPLGFIVAFAIVWGVWMVFLAILRAMIIFIIAIVVIALLLCIAPLFISFILFKRTKPVFENWLKILISTALQPVMIFATIAMLNNIIMGIIYVLLNYDVCTQCLAMINIDDNVKLFCLLNTYLPQSYVATSTYHELAKETYDGFSLFGVPILLPSLMAFVILAHALAAFVEKVPTMVSSIFNMMATELSGPAQEFEDSIRSIAGQDQGSKDKQAQANYKSELQNGPKKNKDLRHKKRSEIKEN